MTILVTVLAPMTVSEAADALVTAIDETETAQFPGLAEEVRRRLNARSVWGEAISAPGGTGGAPSPEHWDAGL